MVQKRTLLHLNGHQLVGLDVETTGLNPDIDEIIQIACVPLDSNFNPIEDRVNFRPFHTSIRPKSFNISEGAMEALGEKRFKEILNFGIDEERAFDLFLKWVDQMRDEMPEGKKLAPLAMNWPFDREFMIRWLSRDVYNDIFYHHARDPFVIATFFNDVSDACGTELKFKKDLRLKALCDKLGIDTSDVDFHDAFTDVIFTARAYRELVKRVSDLIGVNPL